MTKRSKPTTIVTPPAPATPAPPQGVATAELDQAHALLVKYHLTECEAEDHVVSQLAERIQRIGADRQQRWVRLLESLVASARYPELKLDEAHDWQAGPGKTPEAVLLKRIDKPRKKAPPKRPPAAKPPQPEPAK